MMNKNPEQLILIKTLAELDKLQSYLTDKQYISFDVETTGLDKDAEIIGFSVCADVEIAYYVVLSYWDVTQQKLVYLETKEGAKKFISSLVGKSVIAHNAVFDAWKVEVGYGINLIDSIHTDTMMLAHLLDENRFVGLKELAVSIFGEDSKEEQLKMKDSVLKNGGVLTKASYELYKADADLIGYYGAKDALLTLKLFYHLVPDLYAQGLDKFFYEDETMPLLRGPTYQLNTTGLRVDMAALQILKKELEAECMEAKAFIHNEIDPLVKKKYPGTSKANIFNIGSSKQLSWLLYFQLGNEFNTLTKGGKELCKALNFGIPYSYKAKRQFIQMCIDSKDMVYEEAKFNVKTKKLGRPKKVGEPWNYIACGKESLQKLANKYRWVEKYLEYAKNLKLLNTYVEGIQEKAKYGIIRPSFKQAGTTSGRYSSSNPNFQNLPRKDKRVKACIVARPGNVFVGGDMAQLEPRVFAYYSQDERLMRCFSDGDDFYSVIGTQVFDKQDYSLKKDDENSFAKKFPDLRDISKVVGLSATYGTTPFKMAAAIDKSVDEAEAVIDSYFTRFPSVHKFMLECHNKVKTEGRVENLFGRPRRLPEALEIVEKYGHASHGELPYATRNILNLAVNHTIQSTGASIMNKGAIACYKECRRREALDSRWKDVKIVLQVHDSLVLEGPKELEHDMVAVIKEAMENTVKLPGVDLVMEPNGANSLAGLK